VTTPTMIPATWMPPLCLFMPHQIERVMLSSNWIAIIFINHLAGWNYSSHIWLYK
jgi:hypothetical protein